MAKLTKQEYYKIQDERMTHWPCKNKSYRTKCCIRCCKSGPCWNSLFCKKCEYKTFTTFTLEEQQQLINKWRLEILEAINAKS